MKRVRAALLKGTTPGLVLAVLAERPHHGYELAKTITARSAGALALGQGTLYPVLHRLEHEGLIAGTWEGQQGGPERRVYRLTPAGHAALAERRQEWATFIRVIDGFLPAEPAAAPG